MILNRWLDNLNDILVPHIYKGINEIYNNIKRMVFLSGKTNGTIKPFQLALLEVKYLSETVLNTDFE